jgi:Tfp pilus assembly protein PilX
MMRRMHRAPRQAGALLLTVCLMLAILAALAFNLSRSAGMGAHSVAADYERRSAAYLAQAGVAVAKWNSQLACGSSGNLTFSLNGGSVTTVFAKGAKPPPGSPAGLPPGMAVSASATSAGGASSTAGGANLNVVDLSRSLANQPFEQKPLGGITDTVIGPSILVAPGPLLNTTLALNSSQVGSSTALLQFPMKDVPAYSQVINATLSLTQSQAPTPTTSDQKPSVSLYRMTTAWKNDATAAYPTLGASWTGNDYSSIAAGSASTATTAMSWNVTSLVDGWISGLVPDDGMMLRLNEPGTTATFYSNEAGAGVPNSAKPTLTVSFAKPCP